MRITFIISSLEAGGAERVISVMANYWAERDWQVNILTFDDGNKQPFFHLHDGIKHHSLNIAGESKNAFLSVFINIKRIRVLRKKIIETNPDAVISFIDRTNILTLLATVGLGLIVVVSERSNPKRHYIGKIWHKLRRLVYPLSSCIVVQSREVFEYFPLSLRRLCKIIPNPVTLTAEGKGFVKKGLPKKILAIGRLSREKGFDMLLEAFAGIHTKHSDWILEIWGEGAERDFLERRSNELGLKGKVYFPGNTKNPYKKMFQSDLFVLSSRYEGFPNVLCEAMACGLPVVSFDCPCGPSEIIRDGIDGLLVSAEDTEALAEAMEKLISDEQLRDSLSSRSVEILERFGVEKVMGMWEDIIKELVSTNPQRDKCI